MTNGIVVVSDRFDGITVTDDLFTSTTSFNIGAENAFVTFAAVPLLPALFLPGGAIAGLAGPARRHTPR